MAQPGPPLMLVPTYSAALLPLRLRWVVPTYSAALLPLRLRWVRSARRWVVVACLAPPLRRRPPLLLVPAAYLALLPLRLRGAHRWLVACLAL